jgi:general secretion pathway protein D
MSTRQIRIVLLLLFPLLLLNTAKAQGEELISFDFDRVDINLIIRFISELTGVNFIVDPRVHGHITVISPEKIPVKAAYPVFKSILEMYGFSLVQAGEMVKIIPAIEARQQAIRVGVGRELAEIAPDDIIVTQLIPLKHVDVEHVRALLTPLVSRAANMVAHFPTNLLILTETVSNLERLLKVVKEVDVERVGIEKKVIPLQFASATALMPILAPALEHRPGMPRERITRIIPDERTNSLVVMASTEDMREVQELIERLDKEALPPLSEVHVYHLENAKAKELIAILNGLHANRTPAPGSPLLEVQPNIIADEATNSLIIIASPQDHAMFRKVIEELDIRPRQVLVEMLIIEASVDAIRQLGVELAAAERPVKGEVTGMAMTDFVDAIARAGAGLPGLVLGAIRGTTTIMGHEIPNIIAIIQAHAKDIGFEVLASPHIVTSDNKEAHIMIGERVPYVKESRIVERPGLPPEIVKVFGYRDIGIELKITPRISPGRVIHLDVDGSISGAVGKPVNGAITTTERKVSTTMTVEDGATVVIGGLTRDDESRIAYRVPILGYIPVLGWLFRREEAEIIQRNLLIFIAPRVVETAEEAEAIRREKKLEHKEFTP